MAVVRCEQGHFYDGEKFPSCPHCQTPPPRRRPLGDALTEYRPRAAAPAAERVQISLGGTQQGDEKTVGVFRTAVGCDPVVGWLVCVQGREKGRDYRLHAGRNFMGRALQMDICLPDDESMTRENHCSIVFEPNRRTFLLARGLGDGVSVDGQRLADTYVLQGGETICLGTSAFVFVPFCGKERSW